MIFSARMSVSILVFIAVMCLQGCGERSEDYFAAGKAVLEKNDFAAAVIQFKNAVERDPANAEARYFLGYALGKIGDLRDAEAQVRKAIEIGYDQNVARPVLVEMLANLGDSKSALIEAASVDMLTRPEAKAQVIALKGDVLFSETRVKEAEAAYQEALTVDSLNTTALAGQARALVWRGDLSAAQRIADQVLARSPDDVRALLIRASVLQKTGKLKESIAVLDRVVSLNPLHFFAYTSLLPALISAGDLAGAKSRLARLQEVAPKTVPTYYLEGLVAYASKDLEKTRELVRQVLKVVPDHSRALLLGGMVESDLGNYGLAIRDLERLVALLPTEPVARRLLARAYFASGQTDRARTEMNEVLRMAPDDADALALGGEIAIARRDFKAAIDYFRRAVTGRPANAVLRTRLGEARLFSGDVDQGLKDLEAARALAGGRMMADAALVAYRLSRKEVPGALELAKSMVSEEPENPVSQQTLATAARASRDYTSARKALEKLSMLTSDGLPATRQLAEVDVLEGHPEAARSRLSAFLERQPRNEEAALLLAAVARRTGEPSEAVLKILDSAIAANPLASRARLEKMTLLLANGDTAQALDAAQQAISIIGEDPAYLLVLAKAQSVAKEYTQAITTYGKLSRALPNSRVPYMGQVEVYAAEQKWKLAREAAVRAVGASPDDVAARLVLVDTGIRAEMFDQAVKDALAIQGKWPDAASGYSAEAHAYLAQRRTADAEGALRKGIARTRDPTLVTRLAALYQGQDRKAEAEAFLEKWFADHPDDVVTLDALGRSALDAKDFASAERWFRKALQAKPSNAAVLNNLAWALGKLKNPEAVVVARRAVEAEPKAAQFQATLGAIQLGLGDPAGAEAVLRKAIDQQPSLSWAHVHLGRALLAQGKKDEAKKALANAKKLSGLSSVKEELDELERGVAN